MQLKACACKRHIALFLQSRWDAKQITFITVRETPFSLFPVNDTFSSSLIFRGVLFSCVQLKDVVSSSLIINGAFDEFGHVGSVCSYCHAFSIKQQSLMMGGVLLWLEGSKYADWRYFGELSISLRRA
eukprot:180994-Hanusia_phi.AAC.6